LTKGIQNTDKWIGYELMAWKNVHYAWGDLETKTISTTISIGFLKEVGKNLLKSRGITKDPEEPRQS
jgi:hypothetical protein